MDTGTTPPTADFEFAFPSLIDCEPSDSDVERWQREARELCALRWSARAESSSSWVRRDKDCTITWPTCSSRMTICRPK